MDWLRGFRDGLVNYFRQRMGLALSVLLVLAAGVVAGALAAGSLGGDVKQELVDVLQLFFRGLSREGGSPSPVSLLRVSALKNLRDAGLLWILGVTVVGFPGVLGVIFIRGFALGFTVGFLVDQTGFKGIILALFSIFPQNILAIPALTVIAVAALSFSLTLFRNRFGRHHTGFYQELAAYSLLVATMAGILLGSSLIEAFIAPVFLRLMAPMV
ncbi:MAG: stage II sporulation protein M [Actinobacteria bacterium]|nr:stage II sporulation protein M [Actinomycetota bacterium]